MKVGITGGSGFIGKLLTRELCNKGHEVIIFSRKNTLPSFFKTLSNIHLITTNLPSSNDLEGLDGLINLTGESILGTKWDLAGKKSLWNSRVDYTKYLVDNLLKTKKKPSFFIAGSAIGFYGMYENEIPVCTEDSIAGSDFLADLCKNWEIESTRAVDLGIRTTIIRTGIVLDPNDGALKQMIVPFKLFTGGPIGNGRQYMSWIHREDMIGAIIYLLENPSLSGIYNMVAPNSVSNEVFSNMLGETLNRPSFFRVPGIALNLIYGEASLILTKGQNVKPKRLIESGYQFKFPELKQALKSLLK